MNDAIRHGHRHPHDARAPGDRRASGAGEATSMLRRSAAQRLVIVTLPILALWLAVAFALDLLA